MHRITRFALLACLSVALMTGACNKIPDHARYIPKDAVAVISVNLRSLSKKIAWNMITGSKLFKEMQKRIPEKNAKDAMLGIEKAGIDALNVFYVYVKTDARFSGGNRVTGLVPLSDAAQWESYIRQVFPDVKIVQKGEHKEASLGTGMYVSWNKNLLMIMNVIIKDSDREMMDTVMGDPDKAPEADWAAVAAEMEAAYTLSSDNSVTTNKHFSSMEMSGHDITFWLNYDQLMTQYNSNVAEKVGMSLSGALWKDAAFSAGFDFKKGKITGDLRYFMSPDLKDIGAELGGTNVDKDMMERLPSDNMDILMAFHISPKGIKQMLEKTGYLGLANVSLTTQNMSVDNVLDAFTGDMAVIMNDFSLKSEAATDSLMGQAVLHYNQKPSLNMSYVIKINKKDEFQKLVKLARENGLQPMGNGFVIPISLKDSVYIMMNDQYVIAANNYKHATGFLSGDFKATKMRPEIAKTIMGHPVSMYVDIQQLFKNVDNTISHSAHDSAMIAESKKLLNNCSLTGGAFVNNAFEYHMDVNFMNPDENSIIELMDYGMKMSDADKAYKQ